MLSAYEEVGIRVVFSLSVRDVAALDVASFMPSGIPDHVLKAIAGESRTAKSELDFIAGQMQRRGARPGPGQSWALGPSGPAAVLAGIARRGRCPVE